MNSYLQLLKHNLETIMQCPNCGSQELNLILENKKSISCKSCHTTYDVTEDHIPIMFPLVKDETREANIQVYDSISGNYLNKKIKNPPSRLFTAFSKIAEGKELNDKLHLDFGCGPGFILHWLKKYKLKGVGLDVSLENLRNARELTGAFVVCGDASLMPFRDGVFDVVTESAVIHHITNWQKVITESVRIAKPNSAILFDSEPSTRQMALSPIARFVYWLRKPVYKIGSVFSKGKNGIFNQNDDLDDIAEIHNQPGKGLPDSEILSTLEKAGFKANCVHSPNGDFVSKVEKVNLPRFILNVLSFRNPWDPKNGSFSIIAFRN